MEAYQQRVVDELNELGEKTEKLRDFFQHPTFSQLNEENQFLLSSQYFAMATYREILKRRVKLFEG